MSDGKDERVKGAAAQALLNRGWGKPKVGVLTDKSDHLTALLEVQNSIIEHRSQSGHKFKCIFYNQVGQLASLP